MNRTPPPQSGTWLLTAPDGRTWSADSPLRACAAEQRERVPAVIALDRIHAALAEPDEFKPEHLPLARFYNVQHLDDLVDAMERHITRLQGKLPSNDQPAVQHVREG